MSSTQSPTLTRRNIAKAAVWSTPVLVAASAVPAYAASPEPRIRGWLHLVKDCSRSEITVGPSRKFEPGLWVENARANIKATNAMITFYMPHRFDPLRWQAEHDNGAWSIPQHNPSAPQRGGYTAYTTRYSGTWDFQSRDKRLRATSHPSFYAPLDPHVCSGEATLYLAGTVTIDGNTLTANSDPLTLGH